MAWQDNLLPASFRGAAFFYADVGGEGGRRLAAHEFPLREDGYVEDLGRKLRAYRIQAYVLGDNYFSDRDALIDALESADGPGTLQHPYLGPLTVNVQGFRWRETQADGRMASFEIEFIEDGTKPSPTSSVNTQDATLSAADSLMSTLGSLFTAVYVVANLPSFVGGSASGLLGNLVTALGPLLGWPGVDTLAAVALIDNLAGLFDQPAAIATNVTGFFTTYAGAAADSVGAVDETLSSRGAMPAQDPTFGLTAFSTWGADLPSPGDATEARIQESANQAALVMLVQGSAIAAIAQLYANTTFTSSTDAQAAIETISDLIDAAATAAADAGDDTAYKAWNDLYQAVVNDLTVRGKQLASVVTYELRAPIPSLTLAQRFYQDASRSGELISRNAAPHPLFMPRTIEALTS